VPRARPLVQTAAMGIDVRVVVAFPAAPGEASIAALDHRFGGVAHEAGSRIVVLTEHVSVSDDADAIAFVRDLVLDAVPPGSKISEITTAAD
jgi:hypothetical protein